MTSFLSRIGKVLLGDNLSQERMAVQSQAIAEYSVFVARLQSHVTELHQENNALDQELGIAIAALRKVRFFIRQGQEQAALDVVHSDLEYIDKQEDNDETGND